MPNIEDGENTQEGVKGRVPLQEWFVDLRHGYVVTRVDENGRHVVLWRDIENMFANNVPKYAKRGGVFPVPFHVHRDLTEKLPRRISYYENETIQLVLRSLDPVSDKGQLVRHELMAPDILYFLYVALFFFTVFSWRSGIRTASEIKRD